MGQCPLYFWPFWTEKVRLLGEEEKKPRCSRWAFVDTLWSG